MSFFSQAVSLPRIWEHCTFFIFRHNKNVQNSKSKCSKTFFANTWCSGLRAGAPVQAAEISFRSWERTPGQPHPPLTHTGKKEEKHFSFGCLSPTHVRGKRTRKTRSPGNACYAYFNFPSPTPHQKNLLLFYDFSTFVSIKIHRNWKVPFPWSFPAPKGFANELKWIFCAAGFWFWSRFVLRLLTTQRFNKTQRFVLRLTTQHNTTFHSRYNSQTHNVSFSNSPFSCQHRDRKIVCSTRK